MPVTSSHNAALVPPRPPKKEAQDYRSGLRWSLTIHGLLLAFVIIKSLIFPGTPKKFIPSLRVDIVGLPDILKQDLSSVSATPPANSVKQMEQDLKEAQKDLKAAKDKLPTAAEIRKNLEKAAADEMVLKPKQPGADSKKNEKRRQKKMKSALDRIKALEKITAETQQNKALAGLVIKGNKVSRGSSLSGDARESDEVNYYDSLRGRLQDNWALPVWLSRQNLSAQVQIYLDGRGRLRTFRFLKLSGNAQFDNAVKQCLKDSEPFPAPPGDLTSSVLLDGVLIGFPL